MKLITALNLLLLAFPPAFGAENSGGSLRRTSGADEATPDRYWILPVKDFGLTCIDNSIRAGGDKDDDYKCITEGKALCITYDHQSFGGKWMFGIQDGRARLWDPKMEVVWEFCTEVTHVCIGEEHGYDPDRFSREPPYMTFYNEKTNEVVGKLTCDGTDGKDDKNLGQPSILKMVDQADLGQYVTYPIDIVKFKKGQTPDPEDDNALWNITLDPTDPRRLWWDSMRDFDATYSYNQDKCVWTDQCPSNAPSSVPSASASPSVFPSSSPSSSPSNEPSGPLCDEDDECSDGCCVGRCISNTANQCVLKSLYEATNGKMWSEKNGWNFTIVSDPCESGSSWFGVTCEEDDITDIELDSNNLDGTIPSQLRKLPKLMELKLHSNDLSGTIPKELGDLMELRFLVLYQNSLNGTIPTQLGELMNLEELEIYSNGMTGPIPAELGMLENLTELDLHANDLSGTIPKELGDLMELRFLVLYQNSLNGTIPTELGQLKTLETLWLSDILLTGGIPTDLGNLSSLKRLLLSRNKLTGAIPTQLAQLVKLEKIFLQNNMFSNDPISGRAVPDEVCDLFDTSIGSPLIEIVLDNDNGSNSIKNENGCDNAEFSQSTR